MTTYGKNMKLYTSSWQDAVTFKMLPVTSDCPYAEVIYNPAAAVLVVLSKHKSNQFQFINKVDDEGYAIKKKHIADPKDPYKQQRVQIELMQEHFIFEYEEQLEFIKDFAVNAETYNFSKYLRNLDAEAKTVIKPVEQPGLVDEAGLPIKSN